MTMGKRIRRLRKERKLSQEFLAEHLGVSRQAVSKWENDVNCPDTQKLIKLAELFHVSMEYLTTEQDYPRHPQQDHRLLSTILKRASICFFIAALTAHCIGLFSGEFTRNLIPFFPYLWYGTSVWAVLLNVFAALFTIIWIVFLVIAVSLDQKPHKD